MRGEKFRLNNETYRNAFSSLITRAVKKCASCVYCVKEFIPATCVKPYPFYGIERAKQNISDMYHCKELQTESKDVK